MEKKNLIIALTINTILIFSACTTVRSGAEGENIDIDPSVSVISYNKMDLDVSPEPVEYTIDISTPEGKAKLNKLKLSEAKVLAATEAVMKNKCAVIFNPRFTHLKKGNRILRITVYGFPATYKNQGNR